MPRRRRTRSGRPREATEQDGAPRPEGRRALSTVAPEKTEEQVSRAPRRISPSTSSTPKAAPRHISRDYSYVPGELKRIAITVGVIVAGLIGAAIALR